MSEAWSVEELDAVKRQYLAGASYADIGHPMGRNRNAIAGLVFRLKQRGELVARQPTKSVPKAPRREKRIKLQRPAVAANVSLPIAPKNIDARKVPLFQLQPHQCRYVLDDKWLCDCPFDGAPIYCGLPVWAGQSWCVGHAQQLFYRRGQ